MSEPFLGQIMMVGFNFAPRGWALCDGQLLSISSNTALFALLGTAFGGDGRTTFGLPELRGRTPLHVGSGPGQITLYRGQEVVKRNIPPDDALDELIELIRGDDNWVEPEE